MIDPLYQKEILRLAAEAAGAGRLDAPDASASVRNPLCGDQITLDLKLEDGRITALAHHTRACVLCQASAALLSTTALGRSAVECREAAESLRKFLAGDAGALDSDIASYEVFAPVVPHTTRHTCVMLPFMALDQALTGLAAGTPARPGA